MGFKRTSEGRVFFQSGSAETEAGEQTHSAAKGVRRPLTGGKPPPRIANEHNRQPAEDPAPATASPNKTQMQIIALLKSLNDRLQDTQAERKAIKTQLETYKALIAELEGKAARREKDFRDLQEQVKAARNAPGQDTSKEKARLAQAEKRAEKAMQELAATQKTLAELEEKAEKADRGVGTLKARIEQTAEQQKEAARIRDDLAAESKARQEEYDKLIARIEKSESRQDELGQKVDEALSQQQQLMRKIDKAIEDRARFMRKIERIEETVLLTRDELRNTGPRLPSPDENKDKTDEPDSLAVAPDALIKHQADIRQNTEEAGAWFWPKNQLARAAIIGGVIFASLLAGWAISQSQRPAQPNFEEILSSSTAYEGASTDGRIDVRIAEPPAQAAANPAIDTNDVPPANDTTNIEAAYLTSPGTESEVASNAADDIGMVRLGNPEELEALLENDPDELAALLNRIEPGGVPAQDPAIDITTPAENPASDTTQAEDISEAAKPADPPSPVARVLPDEPDPQIPPPAQDPGSLIKADGRLPDVIKVIEGKAFEGIAEAQHDLAAVYTAGHAGVRQDYDRAAFWFEQAARHGLPNASYNLGVLYHQGLGVDKDLEEAIRWYRAAAGQDHPEAQYNLGIAYIEGIGVDYDPERAAAFFENAARSGILEAAYNLGLIHENGLLGQARPDEALMWYKMAADQGSPEAQAALQQLAKSLDIGLDEVNRLAEAMRAAKGLNNTESNAPNPGNQSEEQRSDVRPSDGPQLASQASVFSANREAGRQMLVGQVQEYLMNMGLYPGPADGVNGPQTRDAIRSYQAMNGLEKTGEPTRVLLTHMLDNGLSASP